MGFASYKDHHILKVTFGESGEYCQHQCYFYVLGIEDDLQIFIASILLASWVGFCDFDLRLL
jgi:hypothetical protein